MGHSKAPWFPWPHVSREMTGSSPGHPRQKSGCFCTASRSTFDQTQTHFLEDSEALPQVSARLDSGSSFLTGVLHPRLP